MGNIYMKSEVSVYNKTFVKDKTTKNLSITFKTNTRNNSISYFVSTSMTGQVVEH